ncbi:hypothetical protein KLAECK443B_15625 [Klebsiella aerogenes]
MPQLSGSRAGLAQRLQKTKPIIAIATLPGTRHVRRAQLPVLIILIARGDAGRVRSRQQVAAFVIVRTPAGAFLINQRQHIAVFIVGRLNLATVRQMFGDHSPLFIILPTTRAAVRLNEFDGAAKIIVVEDGIAAGRIDLRNRQAVIIKADRRYMAVGIGDFHFVEQVVPGEMVIPYAAVAPSVNHPPLVIELVVKALAVTVDMAGHMAQLIVEAPRMRKRIDLRAQLIIAIVFIAGQRRDLVIQRVAQA